MWIKENKCLLLTKICSVQTERELRTLHYFKWDNEVTGLSQISCCMITIWVCMVTSKLYSNLQRQRPHIKLLLHNVMTEYLKYVAIATAKHLTVTFHSVIWFRWTCFPKVSLWPPHVFTNSFPSYVLSQCFSIPLNIHIDLENNVYVTPLCILWRFSTVLG